jgi:hypothetical protein
MANPSRTLRLVAVAIAAAALAGCSMLSFLPERFGGTVDKPKPAALQPNPNLLGVRQAWTAKIGKVDFPLVVAVHGNVAAIGSSDGTIAAFDATTGREQWRGNAGAPLAAGIGFDGSTAAVVTRNNDLVAFVGGKEVWRQKLGALSYTPPLVAGACGTSNARASRWCCARPACCWPWATRWWWGRADAWPD